MAIAFYSIGIFIIKIFRNNILSAFTILFFLLFIPFGNSQNQDKTDRPAISLSEVNIIASKINKESGYKRTEIDSIALNQLNYRSFGEMLSQHSPIFIKTYGGGGLATASFRGTSASHTKVLWNGIEINSPMLGQTDFSTIPIEIADAVTLYHGGNSIQNGSGALGGSIAIESNIDWSKPLMVIAKQLVASFNTYESTVRFQIGTKKFMSKTRFQRIYSKNDFSFPNYFKDKTHPPIETREQSNYSQLTLMQEFCYKTGVNSSLSVAIWGQQHHRNIPAPLGITTTQREEQQTDDHLKGLVWWKISKDKYMAFVKSAYFYDYLNYIYNISNIDSRNISHRATQQCGLDYYVHPSVKTFSSLEYSHINIETNNYSTSPQRNCFTGFIGAEWTPSTQLNIRIMFRQQYAQNRWLPIIPSSGIDLQPFSHIPLFLKGNISKNYRLPSLNDLYWTPGGNANLNPEEGFSWECGLKYEKNLLRNGSVKSELTYYHQNIDNWIIWAPDSVMNYWTPHNLRKVIAKGIESNLEINYKYNHSAIKVNGAYYYTLSKNRYRSSEYDVSYGKQLIYVPIHSQRVSAYYTYKQLGADFTFQQTGKRFITSDNLEYLPFYSTSDISCNYTHYHGALKGTLHFKINNIFNNYYEVMAYFPMPGRHFILSLTLTY